MNERNPECPNEFSYGAAETNPSLATQENNSHETKENDEIICEKSNVESNTTSVHEETTEMDGVTMCAAGCMENVDIETSVFLDCFHTFHFDCIRLWFEKSKKNKCPVCRSRSLHFSRHNGEKMTVASIITAELLHSDSDEPEDTIEDEDDYANHCSVCMEECVKFCDNINIPTSSSFTPPDPANSTVCTRGCGTCAHLNCIGISEMNISFEPWSCVSCLRREIRSSPSQSTPLASPNLMYTIRGGIRVLTRRDNRDVNIHHRLPSTHNITRASPHSSNYFPSNYYPLNNPDTNLHNARRAAQRFTTAIRDDTPSIPPLPIDHHISLSASSKRQLERPAAIDTFNSSSSTTVSDGLYKFPEPQYRLASASASASASSSQSKRTRRSGHQSELVDETEAFLSRHEDAILSSSSQSGSIQPERRQRSLSNRPPSTMLGDVDPNISTRSQRRPGNILDRMLVGSIQHNNQPPQPQATASHSSRHSPSSNSIAKDGDNNGDRCSGRKDY